MHKQEMLTQRRPAMDAIQGGYSLKVERPGSKEMAFETYASLAAVVTRATELIEAGYSVGIWSAVSSEEP